MRDELKGLTESEYWVYGITEYDFDHAVDLVRELINARTEQFQREEEKVRAESSDVTDDILDDVAYYKFTDNQYLWQFCLWRLQGLTEAVISHQLLGAKPGKLMGLKAKLGALRDAGYAVSDEEEAELLLWANLRNAISHAPPEQYRPVPFREDDIVEYQKFVKNLYLRWQKN